MKQLKGHRMLSTGASWSLRMEEGGPVDLDQNAADADARRNGAEQG